MTATFHVGDAIEVMSKLPEKSVDLILTSPPFLALRSYLPADHPDKKLEGGSQSTPGEYIDWLLDVVEACARVLAPHGSLVFELGDTYAGSGGAGGDYDPGGIRAGQPKSDGSGRRGQYDFDQHEKYGRAKRDDYKRGVHNLDDKIQGGGTGWPLPKSLSLIPETFRFAMVYGRNPHTGRQTAPWRLRNVIRWVRPNPPVGALGDKFRPATSELMVFCKSAKRYFDLDAVREPYAEATLKSHGFGPEAGQFVGKKAQATGESRSNLASGQNFLTHAGAPPLDWWNIPPGGYEGAHYAVWPPELLIKPVKAMCPEKVCRQCGEPSRRIVEPTEEYASRPNAGRDFFGQDHDRGQGMSARAVLRPGSDPSRKGATFNTIGFSDCGHDDWRPGLILDPFAGSGTTLAVATGHGRDAIGIDLDERNYDLALERVGPLVLSRGEIAA